MTSADIIPCPFCNAKPKHGLGKVQYDQLHGDPFQRYRIWCPQFSSVGFEGSHARIESADQQTAFLQWNMRPSISGIPQPEIVCPILDDKELMSAVITAIMNSHQAERNEACRKLQRHIIAVEKERDDRETECEHLMDRVHLAERLCEELRTQKGAP